MSKEALKMALEALEQIKQETFHPAKVFSHNYAIIAIKEALTQPEQEPVAYLCENAVGHKYFRWKKPSSTYKPIALYTAPPQRTWVGLTDEEVKECFDSVPTQDCQNYEHWRSLCAHNIEAKLKEKNT